jgi:hypothetical protein
MASQTLTYTINLNGNITKGVLDISGAATKAAGGMDKLAGKANKIANIGFAFQHITAVVGKFTAAMDKCVKAYEMQAVAEKKLETLMRNNVSATDAQIQSIKDLTAAQQKLGVIGDEVQLAGAQELSTYLTKSESIKKLIPALNDMLAQQYGLNASQEQAVTIAQMMGKVLDGQVGALSRYGYRFDEAQEAVLKLGTEEQKVAMLSGILTKYIGGTNAALAATPEGKWKQHQNNVGDLRERIGGLFVAIRGALMPAFEAVSNIVQRLTAFFEENKAAITGVAETIGNVLSGAFSAVGGAIAFVVEHWKAFTAALIAWKVVALLSMSHMQKLRLLAIAHTKALNLCTGATNLFAVATRKLKLAFDALSKHPWLIAITAAIGLTVALVGVFRKFNRAQREAQEAVNGVAAKIGTEQHRLNQLFEAMKKTNPESERRKTLIDQLNAQYPGLLKNQDLYRASIDRITEAQKEANKALGRDIFLKSYGEDYAKITTEINDAKKKFMDKVVSEGINPTHLAVGKAVDMANMMAEKAVSDKVKSISGWSFNPYHRPGYFHDVAMGKSDKETRFVLGRAGSAWEDLFIEMFEKQNKLKALQNYGMGLFGLSQDDLMQYVNGTTMHGGSGDGTNTFDNATQAIATGGTRNTTINISLGKMIENVIFSGTTKENMNEIERNFAEALARTLGVAETAAA